MKRSKKETRARLAHCEASCANPYADQARCSTQHAVRPLRAAHPYPSYSRPGCSRSFPPGSIAQGRFRNRDNPALLHAEDTDFGVIVGGKYPGEEQQDYWRYNLFLLPFYTMPPQGVLGAKANVRAWVPMDDGHTLFFMLSRSCQLVRPLRLSWQPRRTATRWTTRRRCVVTV